MITLGIIGVVAAMTIPNLVGKYKEKVFVTSAKKTYSTVSNAITRWNTDNGIAGEVLTFWSQGSNPEILQSLSSYMNVIHLCLSSSEMKKCGGAYTVKQYKKLNDGKGNTATSNVFNSQRAVLADGAFINVATEVQNGNCSHTFWSNETDDKGYFIPDPSSPNGNKGQYKVSSNCGFIYFDTNGLKGPNQIGVDVFHVGFLENGKPTNNNSNDRGNLNYVLLNGKLIKTENYTHGSFAD